jgi:RluA family pseudouridine synthase
MSNTKSAPSAFDIIFSDDYIIVVNKIAKILVQPSPKGEKNTLTSLLQQNMGEKVFPCHRLDRETTGLIIYAKRRDIQERIMEQFKKREVKKKYLAFIEGRMKKKKGMLIDRILDREGKIYKEKPKEAKTFYRVLRVFENWSVVELEPVTGRTNQLRIQLANIGNPILGESKYAFRRDFLVRFRRLALHAFYLQFIHPVSKDKVILEIDLVADMKEFLNRRIVV